MDPASLDIATTKKMEELGYFFHAASQRDNGPWVGSPSWDELVEALGGEDMVIADYDGDDKFTVTHKTTQLSVVSNSTISALADLWIEVNSQ